MVLIRDFKSEFYEKLIHNHLFFCDHIQYTLLSVFNRIELVEKYNEHASGFRYVILLNCGANFDLIEELDPPEDVTFFVCDSHRPINLDNYYNDNKVLLLARAEDCSTVPARADIIWEQEEDEDEEDSETQAPKDSGTGDDRTRDLNASGAPSQRSVPDAPLATPRPITESTPVAPKRKRPAAVRDDDDGSVLDADEQDAVGGVEDLDTPASQRELGGKRTRLNSTGSSIVGGGGELPGGDDVIRDRRTGRTIRLSEMERERKRRTWERKRAAIVNRYEEQNFHGLSSAVFIFEGARRLTKASSSLLWLAAIGLSEQFISHKLNRSRYVRAANKLNVHATRLTHEQERTAEAAKAAAEAAARRRSSSPDEHDRAVQEGGQHPQSTMSVKLEAEELQLVALRHGSLMQAMLYSPATVCSLELWSLRGKQRLAEFLAVIGLPIKVAEQAYFHMSTSTRDSLKKSLQKEDVQKRFNFIKDELFAPAFMSRSGYGHESSALDWALACSTMLTLPDSKSGKASAENFPKAMDLLGSESNSFETGIRCAQEAQRLQFSQIQAILDSKKFEYSGVILHITLPETVSGYFAETLSLHRFARFALRVYISANAQNKKLSRMALVVFLPYNVKEHTLLALGIPPLFRDSDQSILGKAFQVLSARRTQYRLHDPEQIFFDQHAIELKLEDKELFIDALNELIAG